MDQITLVLHYIEIEASQHAWAFTPHNFQMYASVRWLCMNISYFWGFPTTSLICQPTGRVKTHAVQIYGTVFRGILLIIIPSLALAKDLVGKHVSEYDNTITPLHLDGIERAPNSC